VFHEHALPGQLESEAQGGDAAHRVQAAAEPELRGVFVAYGAQSDVLEGFDAVEVAAGEHTSRAAGVAEVAPDGIVFVEVAGVPRAYE
jgi:hypothetical protein